MYYIQENIIFHSIYTIFDEEIFSKYTNSHTKECKLYDKLLDKISSETELLVPDPFRKDRPALIPILHTYFPHSKQSFYLFSVIFSFL